MEKQDALRLAEWVKDHDKRFEASVHPDSPEGSHVLLTQVSDGTTLEPITSVSQYQERLIDGDDPGPTVRAAWEKWFAAAEGAK